MPQWQFDFEIIFGFVYLFKEKYPLHMVFDSIEFSKLNDNAKKTKRRPMFGKYGCSKMFLASLTFIFVETAAFALVFTLTEIAVRFQTLRSESHGT